MQRIGTVVRDKRVLKLIGGYLRAGVIMPKGKLVRSEEGTPQGGPRGGHGVWDTGMNRDDATSATGLHHEWHE